MNAKTYASGIDFNRVALLLHVVESLRQLPGLKILHNVAMKELEEMNNEEGQRKQLRAVTPAAGPANSAVEAEDGTIVSLAPAPIPNTTAVAPSEQLQQMRDNEAAADAVRQENERRLGQPSDAPNLPNERVHRAAAEDEFRHPSPPAAPVERKI